MSKIISSNDGGNIMKNNIRHALADILRIVLVVALPIILILALILLYKFLWPSMTSVMPDTPLPQQSQMVYPDSSNNIQNIKHSL